MTPHFKKAELACKCGCGVLPQQDFMDKVEALRVAVGFALPVTSAARCPDYNAKVSGTGRTGPHTTGRAIDFGVDGSRAFAVVAAAAAMGFTGLGVNQKGDARFIHIDDLGSVGTRVRPWVWSY